MFKRIWRYVLGWFERYWVKPTQEIVPGPFRLHITEGQFPAVLEENALYVLTEDGVAWEAAMMCPSGCGERLELNLLPDERPRWQYSVSKHGSPSLYPSVNREIGCHAHFWLTNGHIRWATFEE